MKNVIHKINEIFAETCGVFLILLMLFVVMDSLFRSLNRPIQGANELAIFTLVIVVYLGIPNCEKNRKHVKVEALIKLLSPKIRQIIICIVYFLSFLILILVVFSAFQSFIYAYKSREALSGTVVLVLWPVKMFIFTGLLFYFFQIIINTIDEFRQLCKYFKNK